MTLVNELPADIRFINGAGNIDNHTACVMSAVAWVAGEPFGDAPKCASPVVRRLAIRLNDGGWWDGDAERTNVLLPLVPRIVGTAGAAELEIRRARRAADWALTFAAPFALEVAAGVLTEPHKSTLLDFASRMRERADAGLAREAQKAAYAAYAAAAYAAYAAAAYAAAYAADAADAAAAYDAYDAYDTADAAAAYDAADAADAAAAYAAAASDADTAAAYAAADAADAASDDARRLAAKRPLRDSLQALIEELIVMA